MIYAIVIPIGLILLLAIRPIRHFVIEWVFGKVDKHLTGVAIALWIVLGLLVLAVPFLLFRFFYV